MLTLKNIAAKMKLVEAKDLQVKGLRCLVVDPNKAEVRFRAHWVPSGIPDAVFRTALSTFEEVKDVARHTWKSEGFLGVQPTTRLVRMVPKDGNTLESMPYELPIMGVNVLLPICLFLDAHLSACDVNELATSGVIVGSRTVRRHRTSDNACPR